MYTILPFGPYTTSIFTVGISYNVVFNIYIYFISVEFIKIIICCHPIQNFLLAPLVVGATECDGNICCFSG